MNIRVGRGRSSEPDWKKRPDTRWSPSWPRPLTRTLRMAEREDPPPPSGVAKRRRRVGLSRISARRLLQRQARFAFNRKFTTGLTADYKARPDIDALQAGAGAESEHLMASFAGAQSNNGTSACLINCRENRSADELRILPLLPTSKGVSACLKNFGPYLGFRRLPTCPSTQTRSPRRLGSRKGTFPTEVVSSLSRGTDYCWARIVGSPEPPALALNFRHVALQLLSHAL